jgi:molybdopterin converting factor small subunit
MADASRSVTIRLPQALAEYASGSRTIELDVGEGRTLADVLALLRGSAPGVARRVQDETGAIRRFVNVYVGDDECRVLEGLSTPVPPGSVVMVIGSVAGGA